MRRSRRRAFLGALGTGMVALSGVPTGVEPGVGPGAVPRSGSLVDRHEPLEETVLEYMAERDVEAGVLGLVEDVKPRRAETRRRVGPAPRTAVRRRLEGQRLERGDAGAPPGGDRSPRGLTRSVPRI